VTDFGLARLRGEAELTATGDVVGTLRYMSPEQALGAKGVADHRVDIYGLGATLYEQLTLEPALPGQEREELLRRLLDAEPRPPRALVPALPVDLETIVLKALRKDPAERYASAREMADDLGRFLEGQPIQARRPTRRERARHWVRRHATGLTVAAGVLLVVSAVLAVSTALTVLAYREAARKQAYAERSRQVARRAVDQVLTGVIFDWLDSEGPTEPAQRQLLEQLLSCCEELAQEDAGDVDALLRVAQARYRAAAIQLRLTRLLEAQANNEQALALLADLAGRHPDGAAVTLTRAQCLTLQGRVCVQRGDLARAEELYKDAIAVLEPAVASDPDDRRYRYELGKACDQLADLLLRNRTRLSEAEAPQRRAVELFTALSKADPADTRYLYWSAHARSGLGTFFSRVNRLEQAEKAYVEALEICRRLHEGNRTSWIYRQALGLGLNALAGVRNQAGQTRQADAPAREALALAADLDRDYPNVPSFRLSHARSLTLLADILGLTRRGKEAEPLAAKAVAIATRLHREFPDVPSYRLLVGDAKLQMGVCCLNLRRLREAERWYAESADLLLRLLLDNPEDALGHFYFRQTLFPLRRLQTANGSFTQALPAQQAIADELARLVKREPEDRGWQEELGETYRFLGALHLRLGQPARAEKAYRRQRDVLEGLATPSAAAQPEAAYNLAWFLAYCPVKACRDPARAHDLAQLLLQTPQGNNPFTRVVLAAAHTGVGHHDEAARLLEPLAKGAPDAAVDLWITLALVQHHQGRRADACRFLARAARRVRTWAKPLDLERRILLAEVNALLGEPEPILKLPPPDGKARPEQKK
jgi:tetratricopeptide (TPR) repeat protein